MAKKKTAAPAPPKDKPEDQAQALDIMSLPLRVRLMWPELEVVATTVWGEARNQGRDGMLAVACVIMNRHTKNMWYGATVTQVCKKRWQFSCWNHNDPNRQKMLNHRPVDSEEMVVAINVAIEAARVAGTELDPSCGATHYHHKDIDPSWNDGPTVSPDDDVEPCAVIGDHVFYKDID